VNLYIAKAISKLFTQEAQLSLTNRQTLVHAYVKISLTQNATKHSFPCYAVKSCPLVNDCDILAGFFDFCLLFSHLMPSMMRIPSSYRVHIWYLKLEWLGWWMSHDDRLSCLGTRHQRDRHTDSHVDIANVVPTHWRRAAKIWWHFDGSCCFFQMDEMFQQ